MLWLAGCGTGDDAYADVPAQIYRPQLPPPPPTLTGVELPGFLPDDRAEVTIEFWHAETGVVRDGIRALIDAFHEYQPYVRINEMAFATRALLDSRLFLYERNNRLPHMAAVPPADVTHFRYLQVLLPLNPFMDDPHVGISAAQLDDILAVYRAGSVFGADWYSLPFLKNMLVMYTHSLDAPTTWPELERAANMAGLEITVGYDALFASMLAQRGGVFIDYATGSAVFNCEQGIAAMEALARLVQIERGSTDAGIILGASNQMPAGINWGSFPLPGFNGNHAAEFGGDALVLFENIGHSIDERVGAWEFMRFLLNTDVDARRAIDTNTLPVTHSGMFIPFYRAHLIANPAARGGEASIEQGFWRTRHGLAPAVRAVLLDEMQGIFDGTQSAAEGLTRAVERANEILGQ